MSTNLKNIELLEKQVNGLLKSFKPYDIDLLERTISALNSLYYIEVTKKTLKENISVNNNSLEQEAITNPIDGSKLVSYQEQLGNAYNQKLVNDKLIAYERARAVLDSKIKEAEELVAEAQQDFENDKDNQWAIDKLNAHKQYLNQLYFQKNSNFPV